MYFFAYIYRMKYIFLWLLWNENSHKMMKQYIYLNTYEQIQQLTSQYIHGQSVLCNINFWLIDMSCIIL